MMDSPTLAKAHVRIARPSDQIDKVANFYRQGLGFVTLSEFRNHQGFDGIMVGHPEAAYHLEFTHRRGHSVGRSPSKDHLLVFYLPHRKDWEEVVARLARLGHQPVPAFNPYWDLKGLTFEDPDGYRIVVQRAQWSSLETSRTELEDSRG